MSHQDYVDRRGRQVTVGALTLQVPGDRPKTDAEIVDREMLIDQIEDAAEESRETVRLAKLLVKGIRHDIATTASRRRRGVPEDKGLFDAQEKPHLLVEQPALKVAIRATEPASKASEKLRRARKGRSS